MRVVLDTTVFISAVLKPSGGSGAVLELCRDRQIHLLVSKSLIREIGRVLHKPKIQHVLHWDDGKITQFLRSLSAIAEVVPDDLISPILKSDPNDTFILACALRGQADVIVSLDKAHLLPLHPFQGIAILTPGDFLQYFHNTDALS